jgi:hypothetical protein
MELHRPETEAGKKIFIGISLNKVLSMGFDLAPLYRSVVSSYSSQLGAGGSRGLSRSLRRARWRRGIAEAAATRRTHSVAHVWPPTMMAIRWLPSTPVMSSGVFSTSKWRPLDGLAVTLLFFLVTSGFVPVTSEDGHGGSPQRFSGEGGLDCFFQSFLRVLYAKERSCSVLLLLVGAPYVKCNLTAMY